jgi:RimJ/RimL family protein N-acetyltransferase
VPHEPISVRGAEDGDRRTLAELFAAVAAERNGIATEPPVDIERRAESWGVDETVVALAGDEIVGFVHIDPSRFGYGEIGMLVAADWRGRGVGSALIAAAIEWGRAHGLHKLALIVFPHNDAGIALYRKFGFTEEGVLVRHIRRESGEVWDAIAMGLQL